MFKIITTVAIFLLCGTATFATDYIQEIKGDDPDYSAFRIKKSDSSVQFIRDEQLPLLGFWNASTTAALMSLTTSTAGSPNLVCTSSTGNAYIRFPDKTTAAAAVSVTGAMACNWVAPIGFFTGCDVNLVVVASSSTYVSSPSFVVVRIGVNGGALTNVGSCTTNVSYGNNAEYVIDLSSFASIAALVPGDRLAIYMARGEKTSVAATGTVHISGVKIRYNKDIPFSF